MAKLNSLFVFLIPALLLWGPVIAQDEDEVLIGIDDERTVDPDQNAQWREGAYPYSAQPRDMWEVGVHLGHFFIDGDVDPKVPGGVGFGLHVRKAIKYAFSLRADFMYGVTKGIDPQGTPAAVYQRDVPEFEGGRVHRSYKTQYFSMAIQAVVNIGNILFHKERNKWNWYAFVGLGLNTPETFVDAQDDNGNWYDLPNLGDANTRDARDEILDRLDDLMDGDYETGGRKKKAIFRIGKDDRTNIFPEFQAGMGISRKLSKRLNLALEHQAYLSDNDLLDGFVYRSTVDQSNNTDVAHYTSLRLAINVGSFENRTEPLYWLNPLSGALGDLAEVKARPVLDLTDTDGDGVIDMLDQEIDTEAGSPVDTRGVALDSDSDGIPDYRDAEPYSPPGYDVDESGVAEVPGYLTEGDVNNIINQKLANVRTEWFLPMIHFDLDKYYIKPEFYGQLHHVATVMRMQPQLEVVASGHADVRNPDDYNAVLSYRRAKAAVDYLVEEYDIARERFVIQYDGEEDPLVEGLPESHDIPKTTEMQQYLNRRVEFRVATPEDESMEEPDGPDAGEGTPGSSRPGPKYSGNKNSGYR